MRNLSHTVHDHFIINIKIQKSEEPFLPKLLEEAVSVTTIAAISTLVLEMHISVLVDPLYVDVIYSSIWYI